MRFLNILSALFAIVAAGLWLMSARVKTPDYFSVHVSRSDGFGQPLGGPPMFGEHIGQAHSQDFVVLADALKKQSRLSAWAASSAAGAAALQAIALMLA
jgi:hypothetical protein